MTSPPQALGRQVVPAQPEATAVTPEAPATETETANSLLAAMAEAGLDWLLELITPGLDVVEFLGVDIFGVEPHEEEPPGPSAATEPAALGAPAPEKGASSPAEARPAAAGEGAAARDEAAEVVAPSAEAAAPGPGAAPAAAPGAPAAAEPEAEQAERAAAERAPEPARAPPAEPAAGAAEAGGTDEGPLGAWRARVHQAVSRVKRPRLTRGQGAAIAKAGQDAAGKRAQQAAKVPDEAQQAVPKPKQPADLPPFPDEQTKTAVASLDAKLGRTHTPHTLPALQVSPRGTVPTIPPDVPPAPAPALGGRFRQPRTAGDRTGGKGEEGAEPARKDEAKKDEPATAGGKAAIGPEAVRTPAAGVTVTAEAPEMPAGDDIVRTTSDVGAVVARLLAEPDKHAQRVVDTAVSVAYNGGLRNAWPELGPSLVPGERRYVDQELRRVAAAAGESEQVLNGKIAAARGQLSADVTAVHADLSASLETARKDVVAADATLTRTISQWHQLVDSQVQQRAAATRGDADVVKIRADRERLVEMVTTKAGQGVVAYEAAAKKLKAALGTEVEKQRRAYLDAARLDEDEIQARLDEDEIQAKYRKIGADEHQNASSDAVSPDYAERARIEYRPTKNWLRERMDALDKCQAFAVGEIDTQAETFTGELNEAANHAREDIRTWADRRLGYERNWFQQLLDMIADWMAQSRVQTAAWEKRRAAEAAAQVDKDLQFLEYEASKWARMSKEQRQRELASLRADQQVILGTFLQGNGADALGAVAEAMIFRLSMQRRGELLKTFDARVMALGEDQRTVVDAVAKAESGLEPKQRADRLHDAFEGGTNEAMVFEALSGLTPIGGRAVELAYKALTGEELKKRLNKELHGWLTWSKHDFNRAMALLAGQNADAIAVQLDQAMHGNWNGLDLGGTDEDTIFEALRNKSPAEIAAIKKAYQQRYHKDLQLEVKGELHEGWIRGTHDEDRAEALFKSDTPLADAISMDQAMHGGWLGLGLGTDRKTLEKIYIDNDKELEQQADAEGWDRQTLAKKETERRSQLDTKYADKYHKTLASQFVDEMEGPDLDHVAGLREQNWNKVDAARIAQEHDSVFYADDKVINDAQQGHFSRKYADEKRDRNLKIDEAMEADRVAVERAGSAEAKKKAQQEYDKKWPPECVLELRKKATKEARAAADESAQDNFPKLEGTYDSAYKGKTSFWSSTGRYQGLREDVAADTQLSQHDKAMALIEGKGRLSEVQEVHYAIKGAGTDTDIVRDIFKGKNKKDMSTLGGDWEKEHPNEGSFREFVLGDFSGREYHEMQEQIDFGEAENPREKADRARRLLEFENSTWLDSGSSREVQVMKKRYAELEKDAHAYEENEKKKGQPDYDWSEHAARWGNADASAALFDSAVTSHRKSVDVISDTVAQVIGAVVTAIVVIATIAADIATAGAAVADTPAVIAFLGSMWGAITAGAVGLGLTMLAKRALTGKAYGFEEFGVDLAVGVVDIATMAFTAGMGGKVLKGSKSLMALFSKGRVGKILATGIVQGAEGMVQAAPGAVLGQVLNPENFRKGDNAILNVLGGAAAQVGMAGAMSGGMAMLHGLIPQSDLVRMRTDPAYQNEIFERYKAQNPGKTREEFLQRLDGLIAKHVGFDDPRLQRSMRAKLLEHIPSAQRGLYTDVPIVVIPAEEFLAFSHSGSGNAVTVIRNGEPVVIMRTGVSLTELTFEGPHLQQIRDPANAPRVALLEEHRMERWDLLTFDEKVEAYRAKVELEIEAHEQILRSLDTQKGLAPDPAEWAQARDKAQANLDNLRAQLEKVGAITPQERAAGMTDPSKRPDFLDQPSRLFSKDPKRMLASGPTAPPDVAVQRRKVHELRRKIAELETSQAKRGGLGVQDTKNLTAHRERLVEHYSAVPEAQLPEVEAKLFDQKPGESLNDYYERLEGLKGEVELGVDPHSNTPLKEAYETQVIRVGLDVFEVEQLNKDLAAKNGEIRKVADRLSEINQKLKDSRTGFSDFPQAEPERQKLLTDLSAEQTKLEPRYAKLHSEKHILVARIERLERRPSLYYGDKPWTREPLVNPKDKNIKNRIGLVGELDACHTMQQSKFDSLGTTVDAGKVKSGQDFEALLGKKQGRKGIDGLFKRPLKDKPKVTEYALSDSKTSADPVRPGKPTPSDLDTMRTGEGERQLSKKWVQDRLDNAGLSVRDKRNIQEGLKHLGEEVEVHHDDGTSDSVLVRKLYAQTYRDSTGAMHTLFYEVTDTADGVNVKLGEHFIP